MRIRKIATYAVAIAMPLSTVGTVAAASMAGAGAPPDTGSITCVGSQTAAITPGFAFGGTLVTKQMTVLSPSAPSCTGNNPTAAATGTVKIKAKYAKPGTVVGDCSNLGATTVSPFTLKVKWSDKTKSVIAMSGGGAHGAGFLTTGTVTSGSFAGESVSIQSDLDSADITAILACAAGGPSLSTLHLTSTISIS
jgi:hypothetical protein